MKYKVEFFLALCVPEAYANCFNSWISFGNYASLWYLSFS